MATIRSGYIVCIRLDQKPPPECPHRHQGTVSSSGCLLLLGQIAEGPQKVLCEPLRGSHHSRQFCCILLMVRRAQQCAVPLGLASACQCRS